MPGWTPIELFNTGVGLKEGDADPHWQIVAQSDDPHFQPRPAVVTRIPSDWWLENDPARSQWISLAATPDAPCAMFTFRTTFDLSGLWPRAGVLRGGFLGDDRVTAIRLDGRPARVAEPEADGLLRIPRPVHRKRLPRGDQRLGDRRPQHGVPGTPPSDNPMGLRVELSGDILAGYPTGHDRSRGKEGTSMNYHRVFVRSVCWKFPG